MPNVFVVPIYVEVPEGFERAVSTLESHLRRAGYSFYTGEPLPVALEQAEAQMLHRHTTGGGPTTGAPLLAEAAGET